jgi:hypothetical protein
MASSVGHDTKSLVLEIEFRTGQIWQYHGVPAKVYREMISGSIGSYFQNNIKGFYSEYRIR